MEFEKNKVKEGLMKYKTVIVGGICLVGGLIVGMKFGSDHVKKELKKGIIKGVAYFINDNKNHEDKTMIFEFVCKNGYEIRPITGTLQDATRLCDTLMENLYPGD